MIKSYYFIAIFLVIIQLEAKDSRFYQIIKSYDNYEYIYENRNILLKFITNTNPDKYIIDKINLDTAIYRDKYKNIYLAFQSKKQNSTSNNERKRALTVAANGIYHILQNIESSQGRHFLDTSYNLFEINGIYDYWVSKSFMHNKKKSGTFIEIASSVKMGAYYLKENNYDPDLDPYTNDPWLKRDRYINHTQNATIETDISPGVGIGKQVNVTPVYQVFKLEKELIKNEVANFQLSEKTLLALAELFAKHNTYKFKKLKKTKEFKRQLDSIIVQDAAIENEDLRYISPLEIKKILLCKAPLFQSKPKIKLYTTSRMRTVGMHKDIDYPYDALNVNDTNYINFTFKYEHLFGIDVLWGFPLTQYWFLNIRALRNLLSTDKEIDFYDYNRHIKWDEVLDIRWDMQTSWWITNWFLVQAGLNNLPSWLAIPRKWPYKYYLNLNIFIEDYLSFTTTLSHYHSGEIYYVYSKWSESINRRNKGILFNITATYNF